VSVSGFPVSRVFHSRVFSHPSVDTDEQSTRSCPHFYRTLKCCDKFLMLTMSLYAFISLLYKQLLQYTLLKTFTVPSALLTEFAKKFQTKVLASDITFTKLSTKTYFCFLAAVFHLSIKGYCKARAHRSYCFLSMFKIYCKRHYTNLATYCWCTTRREHVKKTSPARRRHSVGGGGGVSKMSAAATRRTALPMIARRCAGTRSRCKEDEGRR